MSTLLALKLSRTATRLVRGFTVTPAMVRGPDAAGAAEPAAEADPEPADEARLDGLLAAALPLVAGREPEGAAPLAEAEEGEPTAAEADPAALDGAPFACTDADAGAEAELGETTLELAGEAEPPQAARNRLPLSIPAIARLSFTSFLLRLASPRRHSPFQQDA